MAIKELTFTRMCVRLSQHVFLVLLQRQVTLQTLAAGAILITGWLYFTTFLTEGEARLNQLGLTCSVVTVSMYLSPLFDLVRHITNTPKSWLYSKFLD